MEDMFAKNNFRIKTNMFNILDSLVDRKEELEGIMFKPAYSFYTDSEKYTVKILLPGIKKENISLNIDKGTLLSVSTKRVKEETSANCLYDNIIYGSIYRNIVLPSVCNIEDCEAKFEDGVLTVTIKIKSLNVNDKNQINIS